MASAERTFTFTFKKTAVVDGELYVSGREVADLLELMDSWHEANGVRKMIDEAERKALNGNK